MAGLTQWTIVVLGCFALGTLFAQNEKLTDELELAQEKLEEIIGLNAQQQAAETVMLLDSSQLILWEEKYIRPIYKKGKQDINGVNVINKLPNYIAVIEQLEVDENIVNPILGDLYFYLGALNRLQGYRLESLEAFKKSIEKFEEIDWYDKNEKAWKSYTKTNSVSAYRNVGILHYYYKDFDKSLNYLNRSAKVSKQFGLFHKEVDAYVESLNALSRKKEGNYCEEMENYYELGMEVLKQKLTETHKSKLGLSKKDIEKRETYLRENGLAEIHICNKEYNLVSEIYKKSIEYYSREKHYDNLTDIYLSFSRMYLNIDSLNAATFYCDKAEDLILTGKANGKSYGRSFYVDAQKGNIAAAQKNFEEAISYYQKILMEGISTFNNSDIFVNPNSQEIIGDADVLMALREKGQLFYKWYQNTELEQTDTTKLLAALETYQRAFEAIELMRSQFVFEEANFYMSDYTRHFYEKAIQVCLALSENAKRKKYYQELAFEIAEKGRLMTFRRQLQEQTAKANIPDTLIVQERALKKKLQFYRMQNDVDSLQKTIYQDSILYAQNKIEDFISNLSESFPKYHELKHKEISVSVKEVQGQLLNTNQALIEYFLGEHALYLFILTSTDFFIQKVERTERLNQAIQDFYTYLEDRQRQIPSDAFYLYQQLLGQVVGELPSTIEHLTLILDETLNYIAFEALPIDESLQTCFIQGNTHQINYANAARLLEGNQEMVNEPSNFVGFTPKHTEENTINTLAEIQAINKLMKGKVFINQAATKKAFIEHASHYNIIHLATHAKANDEQPMLSEIVFTKAAGVEPNEHKLYAFEVYDLELNADMIALSACETAKGKLRKGEGLQSLARAFNYANCQSLIVNLWNANDQVNTQIFTDFYRYLKKGNTNINALHQAKLNYLNKASYSFRHPYYWAGIVVIGEEQTFETNRLSNTKIGLGILLGMVFLRSLSQFIKRA